MKRVTLLRSMCFLLLVSICPTMLSAQPIDEFPLNQATMDNNSFIKTSVNGYSLPHVETGLFPASEGLQEGYWVSLKPGDATLLMGQKAVETQGPVVLTVEYSVVEGNPQLAVVALNAPDAETDGQLAYTQSTVSNKVGDFKTQRMHIVYDPPAGQFLPAVQPSLYEDADSDATVVIYSLSVYPFDPKDSSKVTTVPDGRFDTAGAEYFENINSDQGEVVHEPDNETVALNTGGGKQAANLGVRSTNGTAEDQLLSVSIQASRLGGNDGQTALVLSDGICTSALFVNNNQIALSPDVSNLMVAGSGFSSQNPVYAIVQNGGGENPSSLRFDNLSVNTLSEKSILGLPEEVESTLPESVAATLMLPKALYSGSKGSFSLTTMDSKSKKPVSLQFEMKLSNGDQQHIIGNSQTNNRGFSNRSFDVPNLSPGTWSVQVSSFGETILNGEVDIKKGGLLFIETDKPIYKPGQTIQGRVLFLNNTLSPLQSDIELSISDAKGLKIHKETLTTNKYGVASFELPLANELNFGIWKLSAQAGADIRIEKDIEVDRYVLPSFEIDLQLARQWFLVDERITGTIESRYFFGKPVEGKVHIEALKYVGTWEEFATSDGNLQDGVYSFDLPKVDYVAGTPGAEGDGTVQLKITVTDETGHEESTDALVKIVDSGVSIRIIPESEVIKPGLNQELLIVTETPEGKPLSLDTSLTILFMNEDGRTIKELNEKITTQDGLAVYNFDVPSETILATITSKASYEGHSQSQTLIQRAVYSPGSNFIHLRQRNEGILQVGDEAVFDVFATQKGTLFFDVYANGRTLFSNAVEGREVRFTVTPGMSPKAKLVTYMIQEDNEVSADVLPFDVELSTPVDLQAQFSAEEVKPGDPVQLSIQAGTQSMVGLAIVDESVFALAEGRLNLRNVFAELERIFMEPQIEVHDNPNNNPWGPRPMPEYGAKGTEDILGDHNLRIITSENLTVPKGESIDPYLFWGNEKFRGNVPVELFPQPVLEDGAEAGGQTQYQEPDRVRTFFPETWVWNPELETDASGNASLDLTAPDSITTWKLQAVSTSEQGLGITEGSLRVFQDFFVEPDLPYSVIRGDRFPMRVRVFNYIDQEQTIRITLEDSEGLGLQDDSVQEVTVPANGAEGVEFTLEPTKVGTIPVKLIAQSSARADAIQKNLLVEPEGVRQERLHNGFLEGATETIIDLSLPTPGPWLEPKPEEDGTNPTREISPPIIQIVTDSERLKVSVTASLVGQSLDGLDDLLGMPYGCGEQNMIFLAPDIEVLRYLKHTGQLMPAIRAKAEHFITTGYQRELTFRRQDGSFSAFGEQDESGSLWLTAFVLSTFSSAREVRTIDDTVLSEAASWILSHQNDDGSWDPVGFLIHKELSGGLEGNLALSAFVTNALLEYGEADSNAVDNALSYLENHMTDERIDSYVLSLIAYALAKAEHPSTDSAVNELLKRAISSSRGIHWEPHAVESTGYAAMALMMLNRPEAQPALEWLATQRNSFGGHGSTQDTVVAFKALAQAAAMQGRDIDATLEVLINGEVLYTFHVTQENFDVLQSVELEPADKITLRKTGTGKVLYQVVHAYNIPAMPEPVGQDIQLKVEYSSEHVTVDDIVDVNVTVNYFGVEEETGMSIVDVSIPTGFALVQESLDRVKSMELIKRVEQAGRKVIFYIDHLTSGEPFKYGYQVKARYPVKADGGTSTAYLYYDPETRVEAGGLNLIIEE